MSAPRILVTGGAGYIGSHTCKALAAGGFEPVTFDNLSTGHRDAVRWGPFVHGDILDSRAVAAALTAHGVEAVIHFAARAYVGESVAEPANYYRTNVAGTLSLLDACRQTNMRRIVFSSSCATYGIPDTLPIAETTAQRPISPYGRTKLFAEAMLADEAAAYGLRYVALRYFNAAGADPDRELGERHDPETHLVPLAILAAMGFNRTLTVFGDDYDTADGTCVRDYIHVSDLARAHVLALRHLLDGGGSLALNLGSGHGASILDVMSTIRRVLNRPVPVEIHPRRPGDPPALYADIAQARASIGFVPELSDIETIVATAARFHALEAAS
ncbi:UDP-glucose 4-epimerase GalE [Bosea sp. 117]|uniref:UDP-glucose 4-epimerase GalE n=1 Tax=Bosea sp. 117 TaxID=1125973 RepID=UPI000494CFDE|nr:UDP-glucose 4-epimerase GalE [Bosea sp. 117]